MTVHWLALLPAVACASSYAATDGVVPTVVHTAGLYPSHHPCNHCATGIPVEAVLFEEVASVLPNSEADDV